MPDPVLVEGLAALDTLIHTYASKLAETWPGDEALVGMLVERGDGVDVRWAPRAQVIADFSKRADEAHDPKLRHRCETVVAALSGPRAPGKLSILVVG